MDLSLQCMDSLVVTHRLSCLTICRILVPRPGIEPISLHCKVNFFSTGTPGESPLWALDNTDLLAHTFGGQKSEKSFTGLKSRCHGIVEALRENSFSGFLHLWEATCMPWFMASSFTSKASIRFLLLSSHLFL